MKNVKIGNIIILKPEYMDAGDDANVLFAIKDQYDNGRVLCQWNNQDDVVFKSTTLIADFMIEEIL